MLVDGRDGVRATSAAAWLTQLGLDDVEILVDAFAGRELEYGPEPRPAPLGDPHRGAGLVPAAQAQRLVADGAVLVDVGPSDTYRAEHADGARFARRSELADALRALRSAPVVLTSGDGVLAGLAAADLDDRTPGVDLFVLDGGNAAWRDAGLSLTGAPGEHLTGPDGLYPDHPDLESRRAFYADYVRWGRQAVDQVARDGVVTFRTAS
ncbi:rhodanese-like domain-containing protein [Pseudonocardia endophytica]|uniref:rhodanese-like domain-containing protein n=1 Tax=Pseudonocardia endophytica TaxID=401976 RepID=UPI001FB4A071|nr:rhodanese-like domain-containing protein [Pseudonocardia endophytica]